MSLRRRIGPLPLWAWGIVVYVALVMFHGTRLKASMARPHDDRTPLVAATGSGVNVPHDRYGNAYTS